MEVIILLLFVSTVLAASGVAFFAWNLRQKSHEHADRLALLPLDVDLDPLDLHDSPKLNTDESRTNS